MGSGFIDSHVHFWDTSRIPCAWLRGCPTISAPHGPSELARESAPETPSRIVFVQAKLASTYKAWLRMAGDLLAHLAVPAQEAIFSDNAARVPPRLNLAWPSSD